MVELFFIIWIFIISCFVFVANNDIGSAPNDSLRVSKCHGILLPKMGFSIVLFATIKIHINKMQTGEIAKQY